MRTIPPVALVLALMTVSACDNSGSGTTTPTTPVTLTTETFTGSVDPMGSSSNPFTAAQAGEVDITLTAAGPPPTIFMGLWIGIPGTTCAPLSGGSVTTQASTTAQLVGTVAAGTYCVTVADVGNQTATVSYTVTVAHP
jgi:hypothetical protein